MRKFPERLMIGSEEYRVVFMGELDESKAGMCYMSACKVMLISTRQPKREAIKTFFHEFLHGVEDEFKVRLGHAKINKLEEALTQLFEQL